MGVDVQAVDKKRRVFRAIGIPTVFKDVIGERVDSIEVFAAVFYIGSFFAKAD